MTYTFTIEEYREALARFMLEFVFEPLSLLDIWSLATFWIPGLLLVSLMVLGLFRLRAPVLSVRHCIILLGVACAMLGIHLATGILFIYVREACQPGYSDFRPWSIGIAGIIRGCILLVLASVVVCENLLFAKWPNADGPSSGAKGGLLPDGKPGKESGVDG